MSFFNRVSLHRLRFSPPTPHPPVPFVVIQLSAYLCHTVCMLGWVYPTVVHWVWGPDPWLANEGFRDFAGSGVVHIVGGTTALTAAYWVGPRGTAKFENFRNKRDIPAHSIVLVALGTFLLFIGFIAFNGGSVQAVDTVLETAILARAIINTCLAMGGGGLATVFFSRKIARNKYVLGVFVFQSTIVRAALRVLHLLLHFFCLCSCAVLSG